MKKPQKNSSKEPSKNLFPIVGTGASAGGMKSAEHKQSAKEKLQSMNEELETSKEELQSTNEELITINQELYDRNEELDLARKFSESIIAVLHEPLLVLDKEFLIKMANRAFYKTFEITEEDTLGKVIFELQGSKWNIAELRKELQKIRKEKVEMIEVEVEHTFPSIGTRNICFNIQMLYKEGAAPLILLALGDITERKKRERIIKESEKKFRELVYGLPVAVCLCDAEGYITLYNESAVELWGHKPAVGKDKWFDTWKIFSKEGKPIPIKESPISIALKEGRIINSELSVKRPDGGRKNILPYPQLLYDENNKITGCLITMIDITKQVKSQELVQQHADRLKSFFMQTPAIICILRGPEYIFELANPLYRQFINNPDPIGKKLIDVLPELKKQGFIEILNKVYNTGEPYSGNEVPLTLEREKGELINSYIDFNYQAYNNEFGKTEGILVFAYDVTEKVLARRQLELNAEMIEDMYMNAPAFMCTLRGPKYIYELVNPAYQKLFGSRQIAGKALMEALPELGGQGIGEILDKIYETGEIFVTTEAPIWLAYDEGLLPEERYFNFSGQPMYNEDKKINGILVFGYEVTQEVLAKRRVEVNLRLILESIPQITINANADGKITFFNQFALDYSGLAIEDATTGKGWQKIIHPDDLKDVVMQAENSLTTGEDFYKELRLKRKNDGKYRWHLMRASTIKDDKREDITSWVGVATDIDEQKKAVEKIRIAEEFSRNVLQNSPDCVKVLDNEGIIFFMNTNGLCQMEIEDFNIIKGKPWWELWGEENKQVVDTALIKARLGKTAQFQAYCPTTKGTPKWWDVIVTPIFSSDGAVTQLISVSRDITDRIKKEQKKDEFISIASHEMKTPLTTAKAYLQLLELSLGKDNEDAILYAKKASNAVVRLNDLIVELLDVSKLQNGKLNYNITTFNFNEMVTNTIEDVQYSSPKHAIIKTGEIDIHISGDKDRLQQVIINLLSNAIKYSPDASEVFVNVETNNNEIEVTVKDNGIGISNQSLEKIFERYYRVEDHSLQFQGLGIGLYISYEIILRHQGKLWAQSEKGKGSTFYFTLPLNNKVN